MRALFECDTCHNITPHQQDISKCFFCKKEICPRCMKYLKIEFDKDYTGYRNVCISKCYPDRDFLIKNEISRYKIELLAYSRSERYLEYLRHGGRIVK